MRPSHTVLKSQPVEPRTGIFFPAWRNVLMSGNVGDGVMAAQCGAQTSEIFVLLVFEGVAFEPLEFNANRMVIAVLLTPISRLASMPSAVVATDKLPNFARPLNEKV